MKELTDEEKIDEFIRKNGVKILPPGLAIKEEPENVRSTCKDNIIYGIFDDYKPFLCKKSSIKYIPY